METTREAVRECLGTIPDRPEPAAERVAIEGADGYERHRLEYDVASGERGVAYVLVPDEVTGGGVLAVHPHAGEFDVGKSDLAGLTETSAYHYGVELCRRGHVVCCPDLPGFEERRPPKARREAGEVPTGADYEKFLAMDALLRGSSLQARYLSELASALDVLAGFDGVDPESMGVFGHSLGGQEAAWLAWHDDRIGAAAVASGVARLAAIQEAQVTHNFALYVPGLLEVGDMEDVLADVAPTPLWIGHGSSDPIFPPESVRDLASDLEDAYGAADVPTHFETYFFDGEHELPADVRTAAYDWLDKWLC